MPRRKQNVPHKSPPLVRLRAGSVVSEAGCWIWAGHSRYAKGSFWYGQITHARRTWSTHRLAYVTAKGPIPEGLVIDHLCSQPLCCNPDHLEAVTQRENVLRGKGPCAVNAAKTHCVNGHEFTANNTYIWYGKKRPTRFCRTCIRINEATYKQRKRDRAVAA